MVGYIWIDKTNTNSIRRTAKLQMLYLITLSLESIGFPGVMHSYIKTHHTYSAKQQNKCSLGVPTTCKVKS